MEPEVSYIEGQSHIQVKEEMNLGLLDEATDEEEIFPMEADWRETVDPLAYARDCSFTCHHCGFTTPVLRILKKHIRKRGKNGCPISCPQCTLSCTDYSSLREHLQSWHLDDGPFPYADRRDYSNAHSSDVKTHISPRQSTDCFVSCPFWEHNYSCFQHSAFTRHIISLPNAGLPGKPPYSCPNCDYSSAFKYRLKIHIMNKHTKERPYSCPDCKYRCVLRFTLKTHIMAHHTNERPYSCPHCNYSSVLPSTLKTHIMARHTSERPKSCPYCKYSCVLQAQLNYHIKAIHSHERPYSCPHCEYSCFRKSQLKNHIMVHHTNDPSYYCNYSSVQKAPLKNHIIARHTNERPKPAPIVNTVVSNWLP